MAARLAFAVLVVVAALGPPVDAEAQKRGGVLRIGMIGEPPALDVHWTTAAITDVLTNHVYEGLYTLDENRRPIPMLAEAMPAVSADGLVYTFKLRQGIRFHNGKEMTSEDVVASLTRWAKQATNGKTLFALVTDLRAVDRHTVEMKLKERSPIVIISLAVPNQFAAIYPKEVAEKFKSAEKATDWIGTGPSAPPVTRAKEHPVIQVHER